MKRMVIAAVGAMMCAGAWAEEYKSAIGTTDDGKYTITVGEVVMTVDASKGGKITSFTLNGQEALAQHKKIEGMPFENPNDCGSTFWPSPQSTWNWPPIATYDRMPYTATVVADTLTLVSGKDEKYPYIITKRFMPVKDFVLVEYTIYNDADTAVTVAPWEITRVPSTGSISFQADSLWSVGDDGAIIAAQVEGYTTNDDGIVKIPFTPDNGRNRKFFADGTGWLQHKGDLTLVKVFPNIAQTDAAPGESEIEVYYNIGTTYTEIESQGAYTELAPHTSLTYPVLWVLRAK